MTKTLLAGLTATAAIVFILGVASCGPAKSAEIADLKQMQEEMFEPSVQINKSCSGTVIYSDRDKESGKVSTVVLTAKHCVEKVDQRLDIMTQKYNKKNRLVEETAHKAKVLGVSYKSDLALIKLDDQETIFKTAKVAPKETGESLVFGQDVYSTSYPLGLSKTLTVGTLGYVDVVEDFKTSTSEFYRSTPDIGPGSSGSALFQKTTGTYEVIGVATGQYRGFTFVNMYTPIEEIVEYLDVAKGSYQVNKEEKTDGKKSGL